MSNLSALGLGGFRADSRPADTHVEHVVLRRPLDHIMAFTGFGIDDVVNNPIAKNAVLGYYKLHKHICRRCEMVDLEKQWNPHGLRV